MLCSLWLRAIDIGGYKQHSRVHHSGASKHCRQENVVAGAVTKRYVSDQLHRLFTTFVYALGIVFLVAGVGFEALRGWAFGAFVYFGICIAESDGDVSDFFLPESHCLDP